MLGGHFKGLPGHVELTVHDRRYHRQILGHGREHRRQHLVKGTWRNADLACHGLNSLPIGGPEAGETDHHRQPERGHGLDHQAAHLDIVKHFQSEEIGAGRRQYARLLAVAGQERGMRRQVAAIRCLGKGGKRRGNPLPAPRRRAAERFPAKRHSAPVVGFHLIAQAGRLQNMAGQSKAVGNVHISTRRQVVPMNLADHFGMAAKGRRAPQLGADRNPAAFQFSPHGTVEKHDLDAIELLHQFHGATTASCLRPPKMAWPAFIQ